MINTPNKKVFTNMELNLFKAVAEKRPSLENLTKFSMDVDNALGNRSILSESFIEKHAKYYKKWIREINIRIKKARVGTLNRVKFEDIAYDVLDTETNDPHIHQEPIKHQILDVLWHNYQANISHDKLDKSYTRAKRASERVKKRGDYEENEELSNNNFTQGDLVSLLDDPKTTLTVSSCAGDRCWIVRKDGTGWFVHRRDIRKVDSLDGTAEYGGLAGESLVGIKKSAKLYAKKDFENRKLNTSVNPYTSGTTRHTAWKAIYNKTIEKLKEN